LDYALIQALGTLILSLTALTITIWLAFRSPQAILAKLQIKERIRTLREDHYARLDQHIFRPLSSLIASSFRSSLTISDRSLFLDLKLQYDLEQIRKSRFYPDALKHLQIDYPTFEEDIKELENEISKLNHETDKLQQTLEEAVSSKLSTITTVVKKDLPMPQNSVYLPNVSSILEGYWSTILYRHIELEKPLEEVLSNLRSIETDYQKKIERENEIWFGGYLLMKGVTQDKEVEIISTIEQLRSDANILSKLIELKKKHNELISKSRQIATKFEELSFKIDARKYETVAACCLKPI